DCARRDMPTVTNLFDIAQKHQIATCSIDHHQDNDLYAQLNIVKPKAAAAAMVAEFAIENGLKISADAANCLLLGIIRDTGGFRFQNTDPETLRLTADLMELGANYHDLTQKIFFSEPIDRLKFISYVIENKIQFSENGQVAYTILDDEEFEQFGMKKKDMEGLIDSIRIIDGVIITCMFTRSKDQIKLSLRSCNEKYPVNTIAAEIGGGGHILAAGARMQASSFQPAVTKFLKITNEMFHAKI
ncbi:MAG: DHH family phosphoesterase, partial [Lentisphaeria bacterium]